jgi:hypothetical protein
MNINFLQRIILVAGSIAFLIVIDPRQIPIEGLPYLQVTGVTIANIYYIMHSFTLGLGVIAVVGALFIAFSRKKE